MERYISQETVRRIEEKDKILTGVRLSATFAYNPRTSSSVEKHAKYNQIGSWAPKGTADVTRLGKALAKANEGPLSYIEIDGSNGFDHLLVSNESFLEGLKQNRSIRVLKLIGCSVPAEIMKSFEGGMHRLEVLFLVRCSLSKDGARAIAVSLTESGRQRNQLGGDDEGERCAGLKQIRFHDMNMTSDVLNVIIPSMEGLDFLEELALVDCNIDDTGAISSMLGNTNCNLRKLSLHNNPINNEGTITLANAIAKNINLKHLYLSGISGQASSVYAAFSQAFCNNSSPNETFLSNHSLCYFLYFSGEFHIPLPEDIERSLKLNCSGIGRRNIALEKILQHHKHFDMTSCFDWELKLLPHMISWFDEAKRCINKKDVNLDARKLDAIYQFARAMPLTTVAKAECWESQWDIAKRKLSVANIVKKSAVDYFGFIHIPIAGALVCLFLAIALGMKFVTH